MRFKKQPPKFTKSCSNQLTFDFESSSEIEVNIHTPKHTTVSSSKNLLEKQRLKIRLCEN